MLTPEVPISSRKHRQRDEHQQAQVATAQAEGRAPQDSVDDAAPEAALAATRPAPDEREPQAVDAVLQERRAAPAGA